MSRSGSPAVPVTLLAVGFVSSAIVGYLTIRFFLRYLANHSLAVFAYYRFAWRPSPCCGWHRGGGLRDRWPCRGCDAASSPGFFVTVPLFISVAALVWVFQAGRLRHRAVSVRVLGRAVPGLGVLLTAGIILMVGAIATNVVGKRVLQRTEYYLLQVPVFKTIYAPVKQLIVAFSPDNDAGFKKVVIVEDPKRGHDPRVSDQGVHARSRPRSGAGGGGVRADQSSLSRRCRRVPARSRCSIPT